MAGITSRYISGRHHDKKRRESFRYWIALILSIVALSGGLIVLGRDVAWQSRSQDAVQLAKTAVENGKYDAARALYMSAIENNPYDYEAHQALADILNHRLNNHEGALRHYLYSLAYAPSITNSEIVRREISILRLIRAGELENPLDAIEEMFDCVEGNAKGAFLRRVEIRHRNESDAYWEGWKKRERGAITGMKITNNHEGF